MSVFLLARQGFTETIGKSGTQPTPPLHPRDIIKFLFVYEYTCRCLFFCIVFAFSLPFLLLPFSFPSTLFAVGCTIVEKLLVIPEIRQVWFLTDFHLERCTRRKFFGAPWRMPNPLNGVL